MEKLVAIVIASLLSVTASATDWVLVDANELSITYVDVDSISKSNNLARAFVKTEHLKNVEVDGVIQNKLLILEEFYCDERITKSRALSMKSYLDQKMVFSSDKPTDFIYNYPDTFGASRANFVCSY